MIEYKVTCPLCGYVARCHDSMSDARQELDDHLWLVHPDEPDPTHDPRFPPSDSGDEATS